MFLVVILYTLLALTFIIAKYTLAYATPCFLIGIRMVLAGLVLCGIHYGAQRPSTLILRRDWGLFFKVALFHVYLAFVPEFLALQSMSATKVNVVYSTTPFIAASIAYFLQNERFSIYKVAGIFIGLVSVTPLILFRPETSTAWFALSLPEILLGVSVVSSAYGWFLVQQLMKKGYPLLLVNGIAMLCGGIGALITSFFFEPSGYGALANLQFWKWLILLIVSANIATYTLYGWLCKRYSITFVSTAGFLCPIFGGLFGWLIDGEVITWHYVVSFVGVMVGLLLYYLDAKQG